jgi:hypothetical protein
MAWQAWKMDRKPDQLELSGEWLKDTEYKGDLSTTVM